MRRKMSTVRKSPHPAGQTSSSVAQSWWGRGTLGSGHRQPGMERRKLSVAGLRAGGGSSATINSPQTLQGVPGPPPPRLCVQGARLQEASFHKQSAAVQTLILALVDSHPLCPKAFPGHHQKPSPLPPTIHLHTCIHQTNRWTNRPQPGLAHSPTGILGADSLAG